jgi:exosortase A-associated hydrolase 2
MIRTEAFFLSGDQGARFCVAHHPEGRPRAAVLLIQAFAEEANKSRSNLAAVARACAEAGYLALIGDVGGTGDSEGDFADARWADWVTDLKRFAAWLVERSDGPLALIGLRQGALLASSALNEGLAADALLALAPIASGKLALTWFLRLAAAAELGENPGARLDTRALRASLDAGEPVEVAGYSLSAALAAALEAATLELPDAIRLGWIEIGAAETLSAAASRLLEKRAARGCADFSRLLPGPAFWQTQEIEMLPALPALCVEFLGEALQ